MAAWRRARRWSCSSSSGLAVVRRARRLSKARCSSSGVSAAWGRRAASRYMSCSSMKPSRAWRSVSPRTFAKSRTSERSTGRPSTTARILSTTPARAGATSRRSTAARSKSMADREVEMVRLLAGPAIELVAPVEAQGADRALVTQAQARRVAEVAQRDLGGERIDVARFREGGAPERAQQVAAQLDPAEDERVAAVRTHLVQAEAAQRIVAAREEAVGRGHEELLLAERAREAQARGEGDERVRGEEVIARALHEALHQGVAPEEVERHLGVREEEMAAARVQGVVPGVVDQGGRRAGERARAELTSEGQAVLDGVEGARLRVGLPQDEAPAVREVPRRLQGDPGADVAEGLAFLLLTEGGEEELLFAAQQVRLPERTEHTEAAEARPRKGGEAAVHAEEVPPRHLHAGAQVVLLGVADAVGHGGQGRFLRAHDHAAALRRVGVHLGDGHAVEEAQGAQAALGLEHTVQPQRLAFLDRELPPYDFLLGRFQPADHDVLHRGRRSGGHAQDDGRLRAVLGESHFRNDVGLLVSRVAVRGQDGVPV